MKNKIELDEKDNVLNLLEVEGVNANGYGIMPKLVMQDSRLTIEAKAIYAYIATFDTSETFPSFKQILKDLNISASRFYKHRKLLLDYNFLTLKQVKNSNGAIINNNYELVANPKAVNQHTQTNGAYLYVK